MFFRGGKRGQVRAVDFVVSISLFLLVTTQLFLIIITSTSPFTSNTEEEDLKDGAELLANHIIMNTGSPDDWGFDLSQNPSVFGLAELSNPTQKCFLDAAKIARLDPRSMVSALSTYYVDYSSVRTSLDLDLYFTLQILPLIQLNISSSNTTVFMAKVTDSSGNVIENALVHGYVIHPNGSIIVSWRGSTDFDGIAEQDTISLPDNGFYVYAALARYAGLTDFTTKIVNNTATTPYDDLPSFATEANKTNEGYVVLATPQTSTVLSEPNTTIISFTSNTSDLPITLNQRGSSSIYEARIPRLSLGVPSIIVSRALYTIGGITRYGLAVTTIPLLLGRGEALDAPQYPSTSEFSPTSDVQTVTIERLVTIRGSTYRFVLHCWG